MNKFELIYLDLENKIKEGAFPIGSFLPSENELAEIYNVSRETIRKAQKLLLENGFINKQQGRGSIVLDFHRFSFPISGLVSYKELQQEQHIQSKTNVISNKIIPAPDFIVEETGIKPDEKFIHLVRTREINNEVMIVDEDYIRTTVIPNIPDEKAQNSIYEYFEDELGLMIAFATKEFKAEKARSREQALMDLNPMDYVIDVSSFVYLEDTTFFQYTLSHHRLEKFRFSEFARRRPKIENNIPKEG